MKYKWILAVCLAALLPLSGCQLAQEEAAQAPQEDRLIGALITTEYLDLFDFDSYFQDNLDTVLSGGGAIEGDTSQYEGQLHATLANPGAEDEPPDYVFEGVEGWWFYSAYSAEENCTYSSSSPISTSVHYFSGDEEDRQEVTATIYLSIDSSSHNYYTNPIYQSADGSIYAVSGSGFGFESPTSTGTLFSTNLDSSVTTTENGVSKTESSSVTVEFEVVYPAEELTVVQMDSENRVLTQDTYSTEELPQSITPEKAAAYLLFETPTVDENGEPIVSYQLYDRTTEYGSAFSPQKDGTCLKESIELIWEE